MKQGKGHVLLVDDDPAILDLLQTFLQNEGYATTCFPLASEAFKEMRDGFEAKTGGEVDMIITDLQMAEMDGMEFLRKMSDSRPEIPVILMTAHGSIDIALEAMQNGAYQYITKPLNLKELGLVVERGMERCLLSKENKILSMKLKEAITQGQIPTGLDLPPAAKAAMTIAQLEEQYIRMVLDRMDGQKEKAAAFLGINRRTLYRKEREYGWVKDNSELA